MEMEYANKGVAGAGLGLGIAGTALGLMAGGLNGVGLFGNGCGRNAACAGWGFVGDGVNHYELEQQRVIANKDMEIAYLKSREEAKNDSLALYQYIDGRLRSLESLNNQVAQLMALTKLVIPNGSVCPGWGGVTVTPATTTTTTTTGA